MIITKGLYYEITGTWTSKSSKNITIVNKYEIGEVFKYKEDKYLIDNAKVKYELKYEEIEIALFISTISSKDIIILPKVNYPERIKTPDYYIIDDNEYYDFKDTIGKSPQLIWHALVNNEKQSHNFIIRINNKYVNWREIERQLSDVYFRLKWVKNIAIIKDNKIKMYTRK